MSPLRAVFALLIFKASFESSAEKECGHICPRLEHLECLIDGPLTNLEKLSELFLESQRKTTHNEHSILEGIEQLKRVSSSPVADGVLIRNLTKLLEVTNQLLLQQANTTSPPSLATPLETIHTCRKTYHSGQYLLQLRDKSAPIAVVCLHKHQLTGDGWLVIQQRVDGSENFFRNWVDYRDGFGNLSREFWLGLENIYHITNAASHELLVEMVGFDNTFHYARYSSFEIGSEEEKYVLNKLGGYSGTAGDSLRAHLGMRFSTYDNDNDQAQSTDCAVTYIGAWWYDQCFADGANLNGKYENNGKYQSIIWLGMGRPMKSLKYVRMLLRQTISK